MNRARLISRRRGFTLVEILIAVLVLSLGLLGLAAVFPVVVREQRIAVDETRGVEAAAAAESWLRSHETLGFRAVLPPRPNQGPNDGIDTPRGFDAWRRDPNWSRDGEWVVIDENNSFLASTGEILGVDFGDINVTVSDDGEEMLLRIGDRLWPRTTSYNAGRPRLVWDFVARRVPTRVSASGQVQPSVQDPVQIAIFVRPIDARLINLPDERRGNRLITLYDRLADPSVPADRRRIAVAVRESGSEAGVPTGDGFGAYGHIVKLGVDPSINYAPPTGPGAGSQFPRDRIPVVATGADEPLLRLLERPGQKFVDSLGVVYTVRGIDRERGNALIVDPPVPGTVTSSRDLGEIVFVPQTPSAVRIVTVNP